MNDKVRLAQIFDVYYQFIPTKASVYLKRTGINNESYFTLSDLSGVTIDATNFFSIQQEGYKIVLDDRRENFTGNGYMTVTKPIIIENNNFPIIEYPIRAESDGLFFLWLRGQTLTGTYEADILLDNKIVNSISDLVVAGDNWFWIETSIVLPDTDQHTLGIRLKRDKNKLDKIFLSKLTGTGIDPFGSGFPNTESPFFTIHMQVYKVDGSFNLLYPFFIYDYKNSIEEVVQNDWYNFNINKLDSSFNPSNVSDMSNPSIMEGLIDYSEKAALVMSASGIREDNFIVWEITENDEYNFLPSAVKVLQ